MTLAAILGMNSLLLGFRLAPLVIRRRAHLDQLIYPMLPTVSSLTPPSRPGF